ncbi:hypothetical protein [Rhizobium sp. AC27/96]|nr:hypothetical protein [Rhizobium sp. AC27/96]
MYSDTDAVYELFDWTDWRIAATDCDRDETIMLARNGRLIETEF